MLLPGVKEMDGPDVSSSGTSYRDIHRLIVTVCCSHKLLNFAPYMKETSLFWVVQTCHAFWLFGVEAGVIFMCPLNVINDFIESSSANYDGGFWAWHKGSPITRTVAETPQHPIKTYGSARKRLSIWGDLPPGRRPKTVQKSSPLRDLYWCFQTRCLGVPTSLGQRSCRKCGNHKNKKGSLF